MGHTTDGGLKNSRANLELGLLELHEFGGILRHYLKRAYPRYTNVKRQAARRMNKFAQLISCSTKNDLAKFCKNESVSSPEFTDFIAACMSGAMPLNHAMKYFDYVPPHLETRNEDWVVLNSRNGLERTPDEKKAIRRIFKTHGERRYKVGHMFFSKELSHPIREWHFAFFESDELEDVGNHWVNGSHIHFVNFLWPNLYCQDIWNDFVLHKRFPSAKLHVKFTNRIA